MRGWGVRAAIAALLAAAAGSGFAPSGYAQSAPSPAKATDDELVALDAALAKAMGAERVPILLRQAAALARMDRLDAADAAVAEAGRLAPAGDDALQGDVLLGRAALEGQRQHYVAASDLAQSALDLRVGHFGADSPQAAQAETLLGQMLISQSKLDEGIAHAARGWALRQKELPAGDPDRFEAGFQLAVGYTYARRSEDAESLLRTLAGEAGRLPAGDPYHAKLPHMLGTELLMQGRLNEALPWLREAVDRGAAAPGLPGLLAGEKADELATLGIALLMRDQPGDALPFLLRSAELFGAAQAVPSEAGSYLNAGTAADRAGDRARGLALREKGMALMTGLSEQSELGLALNRFKLAQSYAHVGRVPEALAMERAAVEVIARLRPPDHFQATNSRIALGWMTALGGKPADGLAMVRPAFRLSVASNNALEVAHNQVVGVLENIEAYSQALQTAVLAGDHDFAFEVLQVMVETDASRAAVSLSARRMAGDGALSALLKRRQQAAIELEGARRALAAAQAKASANPDAPVAPALEKAVPDGQAALRVANDAIAAADPRFAALVTAPPIAIAEAQRRLAPDEALLVVEESDLGLYTMAITRSDTAIGHDPVRREELRGLVTRIRDSMAPGAAGEGGFAVAPAHRLYQAIFTPEIARLVTPGMRLRVVTGDILARLPLSLLAARPGPSTRRVHWLIEDHALSVLPSIAAMHDASAIAAPAARRFGFVGIGAPALAGDAMPVAGPSYFARGEDRAQRVAGLRPLSGASVEITAVAKLMANDGAQRLLTGAQATEPAVEALDLKGVDVLLFATHGLVAGPFDANSEPALVLTPPAQARDGDDGLLTASEASLLDIDADWVILSACDTAAGSSTSAAGYTGLARGFLLAGARRVVASHWAVRDDVAARLTQATIAANRAGLAPDLALRAAMLREMRRGGPDAGNPADWAPFMLVEQ